ncbi:CAP-Gly domain-containing linker protein 1 isoform X1 [Poecilia reticulata]|uniref:CAP-Gly domain-containing linker protein 4-like n=2 Tax=Poecilia reticulata TaxID=8081 RepID=A0A3P9NEH4_POERE|nr:PREDICTED: CAP-Gly domain-containing linker protein 1-like isoform X1 [Poecilia reticulata]
MTAYILQTFFTWTYKGILCTCRFLWICPYNAIKFLPREAHIIEEKSRQVTQHVAYESKMTAAIPGSPDRVNALHKRVIKTEREILSIKTRIACDRASWEKRFSELQRQQEELRNQVFSEAEILLKVGTCEEQRDNGDDLDEQSSGFCQRRRSKVSSRSGSHSCSLPGSQGSLSTPQSSRSSSSLSSASSVRSWKTSHGPHRVFVPHSPMDLHLGHRVRIMLPSGRISTGTVRFLGNLQGEPELYLGVELQSHDASLCDGSHNGHTYFECKPGHGAFVPFHKLLMAWE